MEYWQINEWESREMFQFVKLICRHINCGGVGICDHAPSQSRITYLCYYLIKKYSFSRNNLNIPTVWFIKYKPLLLFLVIMLIRGKNLVSFYYATFVIKYL